LEIHIFAILDSGNVHILILYLNTVSVVYLRVCTLIHPTETYCVPVQFKMGVGESSNRAHESSIECCGVRVDPSSGNALILSGDWEGRLCLWSSGSSEAVPAKKQKTGSGGGIVESMTPGETWKAHSHCLSEVRWLHGFSAQAVTSSWDHSIKIWDVEKQDCLNTFNTSKVILKHVCLLCACPFFLKVYSFA
jgi:WD40 repeat protein